MNCARTVDEENLYFYQYNYEVYYVTHECIQPGTELFVWYGEIYGKYLRLSRTMDDYKRRFNENGPKAIYINTFITGTI